MVPNRKEEWDMSLLALADVVALVEGSCHLAS